MKIFTIKRQLQFVTVALLASTLIFTQPCYASNNSTNTSSGLAGTVGVLAVGGIIPMIMSMFVKRSSTQNPDITPTHNSKLISITITPINPSAIIGDKVQFTATGTFDDNSTKIITDQIIWSSTNQNIATINNSGLATTTTVGSTDIQAELSGLVSNKTTLKVILRGGPVILSTSSRNLLYYNGAEATGKVTIKNNSNTKQTISLVNNISPITIKSNSCSSVAAWETCEFSISYSGNTPKMTNFKVRDDNGHTDAISINTIDKIPGDFFNPSVEDTNAHGIPCAPSIFVTIDKNGFDFLYTTNPYDRYNREGNGVLRSSDGGVTWSTINNGLTTLDASTICVKKDFSSNYILFVGTTGGIFTSTDGGEIWTQSTSSLQSTYPIIALAAGKNLYAGTDSKGLLTSTDNGATWNKIITNIADIDTGYTTFISCVTQDSSVNDTVYVVANWIVYKGTYDGTNWTWISVNNELTDNYTLSLYSIGEYLYAGTSNGIFRSSNGGTSWAHVLNEPNADVSHICSIGNILYAATNNASSSGILISTNNGTTWKPYNKGLGSSRISALNSINNRLYIGIDVGIFTRDTDTTDGWTPTSAVLTQQTVSSLSSVGDKLYAAIGSGAGYGSGVFVSADGGANWTISNKGLTKPYINTLYTMSNNLYAGTNGGGVFVTTDGGANWSPMGLEGANVYSLYSLNNILYAGLYNGGVAQNTGGANWNSIGLADKTITSLYSNNNTLYAGSNNAGIFVGTNGGTTWAWNHPTGNTIENQKVNTIYSLNDTLYVGSAYRYDISYGIYTNTNDTGWIQTPGFIIDKNVQDICSIGSSTALYAAAIYDGILFKDSTPNSDWSQISAIPTFTLHTIGNTLYAGTTYGVFKKVI